MSNRLRLTDTKPTKPTKPKVRLMLDSGAFSAWKSGTEVDFTAYIKWLKRFKKYLFSYVTMDVLPGGMNKNLTIDQCAAASDKNLQRMLDTGLEPIPVFHQFEDFKWLVKMVEDGHPYVGISSRPTLPLAERMDWLNRVFTLLCDKQGKPCVKTHGFAMGSPELAYNYPFYTTDSTTWILGGAAFGKVMLPTANPGQHGSLYVTLPQKGSKRRGGKGNHIKELGPWQTEALAPLLEALNLNANGLEGSYINRANISAGQLRRLMKIRSETPCVFNRRVTSWLRDKPSITLPPPVDPFRMRIFCVAWGNVMDHVCNVSKLNNRLKSYLDIQDWNEERFERYLITGMPIEYEYKGKN